VIIGDIFEIPKRSEQIDNQVEAVRLAKLSHVPLLPRNLKIRLDGSESSSLQVTLGAIDGGYPISATGQFEAVTPYPTR